MRLHWALPTRKYIYDSATAPCAVPAHNAPVAQLDWLDGRHVQSDATDGAASARSYIKTPAAHLICFFPSIGFKAPDVPCPRRYTYHLASDGAPVRLPHQLRDAAFGSWTCIYGWPVQGWPALSGDLDRDRTVDVAAADRARTTPLLANGDTAGTVRLVRYPCAQQARSRACAFHRVGPVARVTFAADDRALITIGRQDRAIVVWNVDATATVARGKQDSTNPREMSTRVAAPVRGAGRCSAHVAAIHGVGAA